MPSPRPTKPIPSLVVNFTFTSSGLRPMQRASERRMSSLKGAIFGASQMSVQSTWRTVQPWSSRNVHTSLKQAHAVRALPCLVRVGEVLADVAQPRGTEQGIDDRVREHVRIRVPGEPLLGVLDPDPAEHERAPLLEPM